MVNGVGAWIGSLLSG
ncbi:hypothetical protein M0731_14880, partial [Salmonella enterica]